MGKAQDTCASDAHATTSTIESLRTLAAAEFEPWEGRPEDSDVVPANDYVSTTIMPETRLGLMVVHKSKAELVEIFREMHANPSSDDLSHTLAMDFVDGIGHAKAYHKAMFELCKIAEARALSAMAVIALDGEVAEAGGVHA